MSTEISPKDLLSKNLDELLSMKNSLDLELEEATETLRELKKLKKERQAAKTTAGLIYHADRRSSVLTGSILGGMFNEAHQMTDTYYPPPLTVFANWGPDSMYRADRSDLLLFAAYKASIRLEEEINKIYIRKKKPLLRHWDDVIITYADDALKKPILSVEWLKEAETCWEEFHHWLSTCPADEHPMKLSVEKRNSKGWSWYDERDISDSESDSNDGPDRPPLEKN